MAVGDPTGSDLCSGTTNGNTLPVRPTTEYREITFDSTVELSSGTKYAIIIRATSGDNGNYIQWRRATTNPYSGGLFVFSLNSGSTWSQFSDRDFYFITKASGVSKDSNTTVDASYSSQAAYGAVWIGQTFTASSTYIISSVVLEIARFGNPGTITVSIRAVDEGAPSKPITPTPSDAASDVTLDQASVSWEDGGGATSYDVYYGTESGNLTLLESGVTDTSYTISGIADGSPFDYEKTRYWRIDAVNQYGTTTGDEWSFTTITFAAPPPGVRGYDKTGGGEGGYAGGAFGDSQSNVKTRLVAFARNKVFYEDT